MPNRYGLLLWDAIETFVSGYLKHFYPTKEASQKMWNCKPGHKN
ncbi:MULTISPECIES: hypothetical protein [unclassified Microcoleus]